MNKHRYGRHVVLGMVSSLALLVLWSTWPSTGIAQEIQPSPLRGGVSESAGKTPSRGPTLDDALWLKSIRGGGHDLEYLGVDRCNRLLGNAASAWQLTPRNVADCDQQRTAGSNQPEVRNAAAPCWQLIGRIGTDLTHAHDNYLEMDRRRGRPESSTYLQRGNEYNQRAMAALRRLADCVENVRKGEQTAAVRLTAAVQNSGSGSGTDQSTNKGPSDQQGRPGPGIPRPGQPYQTNCDVYPGGYQQWRRAILVNGLCEIDANDMMWCRQRVDWSGNPSLSSPEDPLRPIGLRVELDCTTTPMPRPSTLQAGRSPGRAGDNPARPGGEQPLSSGILAGNDCTALPTPELVQSLQPSWAEAQRTLRGMSGQAAETYDAWLSQIRSTINAVIDPRQTVAALQEGFDLTAAYLTNQDKRPEIDRSLRQQMQQAIDTLRAHPGIGVAMMVPSPMPRVPRLPTTLTCVATAQKTLKTREEVAKIVRTTRIVKEIGGDIRRLMDKHGQVPKWYVPGLKCKRCLVYGKTAGGYLAFAKEIGGEAVLDFKAVIHGRSWKEFSIYKLEKARLERQPIVFTLEGFKSEQALKDAMINKGVHAGDITSQELRHVKEYWDHFQGSVRFFYNGREQPPPWTWQ